MTASRSGTRAVSRTHSAGLAEVLRRRNHGSFPHPYRRPVTPLTNSQTFADFAPIWQSPWDPSVSWMAGGLSDGFVFSEGAFKSQGTDGIGWTRPVCLDTSQCVNWEVGEDGMSEWLLPSNPLLTGQVVSGVQPDGTPTVFFFDSDANFPVYQYTQTMDSQGIGPQVIPGSVTGGFGRKVFLKGPALGSGCFFSTDYDAVGEWREGESGGMAQALGEIHSRAVIMTSSTRLPPFRHFPISHPHAPLLPLSLTQTSTSPRSSPPTPMGWP